MREGHALAHASKPDPGSPLRLKDDAAAVIFDLQLHAISRSDQAHPYLRRIAVGDRVEQRLLGNSKQRQLRLCVEAKHPLVEAALGLQSNRNIR